MKKAAAVVSLVMCTTAPFAMDGEEISNSPTAFVTKTSRERLTETVNIFRLNEIQIRENSEEAKKKLNGFKKLSYSLGSALRTTGDAVRKCGEINIGLKKFQYDFMMFFINKHKDSKYRNDVSIDCVADYLVKIFREQTKNYTEPNGIINLFGNFTRGCGSSVSALPETPTLNRIILNFWDDEKKKHNVSNITILTETAHVLASFKSSQGELVKLYTSFLEAHLLRSSTLKLDDPVSCMIAFLKGFRGAFREETIFQTQFQTHLEAELKEICKATFPELEDSQINALVKYAETHILRGEGLDDVSYHKNNNIFQCIDNSKEKLDNDIEIPEFNNNKIDLKKDNKKEIFLINTGIPILKDILGNDEFFLPYGEACEELRENSPEPWRLPRSILDKYDNFEDKYSNIFYKEDIKSHPFFEKDDNLQYVIPYNQAMKEKINLKNEEHIPDDFKKRHADFVAAYKIFIQEERIRLLEAEDSFFKDQQNHIYALAYMEGKDSGNDFKNLKFTLDFLKNHRDLISVYTEFKLKEKRDS